MNFICFFWDISFVSAQIHFTYQCDQIWQKVATLAKFVFAILLIIYFVFAKIVCLLLWIFWQFCKFSSLPMAKLWTNNLAVWSHCYSLISNREPPPWSQFFTYICQTQFVHFSNDLTDEKVLYLNCWYRLHISGMWTPPLAIQMTIWNRAPSAGILIGRSTVTATCACTLPTGGIPGSGTKLFFCNNPWQ